VPPAEAQERELLIEAILARNPPPRRAPRNRLEMQLIGLTRSEVTDEAYREFKDSLPQFVDQYPEVLQVAHGQCPVTVTIKNVGPLRAHNLILSLRTSSGWLNVKPVLAPVLGPSPRRTREYSPADFLQRTDFSNIGPAGRHELRIVVGPERGEYMEVHCEDFPAGDSWVFRGFLCIDPRAQPPRIGARITAANLHGVMEHVYDAQVVIKEASISELVDFPGLELHPRPQISGVIEKLWADNKYTDVELFSDDSD
jgi:hypothetical protein